MQPSNHECLACFDLARNAVARTAVGTQGDEGCFGSLSVALFEWSLNSPQFIGVHSRPSFERCLLFSPFSQPLKNLRTEKFPWSGLALRQCVIAIPVPACRPHLSPCLSRMP